MAECLVSNALTTIERVKDELGVSYDNNSIDETLIRYINEATDFIEEETGRVFGKISNKIEVVGGSADNYLLLKGRPILVVNEILYGTEAITNFLVDADDYKAGMVYRDVGWTKSSYIVGLTGDQFGTRRNYTVDYDYGYILPKDVTDQVAQTLPRSLEAIAIKLVVLKHRENQRQSHGLKELKQGRLTLKFTGELLSAREFSTLQKYKKIGVW